MYRINILSKPPYNIFDSQIDKRKYSENKYFICYNSLENIVWDVVVVYENILHDVTLKVKEGGLVYFSGEPPMMHPLPNRFLSQFDTVILPHNEVKHHNVIRSHGYLNWLFGYKYSDRKQKYAFEELRSLKMVKTKNISIITSSQKMMPGHSQRMRIIESLKRDFPGQIDYFGRGICPVDSKSDGILPYRFHICIENSCIPYYWTEKFADSLLGWSVPIYCGCTNIADYFKEGYLTFNYNEYPKLKQIVGDILKNPEAMYRKYLDGLEKSRNILMDKENLIPFVIERITKGRESMSCVVKNIRCYEDNPYSFDFIILRLKRLFFKMYFRIKFFLIK